jgi:uncharacterized protein (DUF983 family)
MVGGEERSAATGLMRGLKRRCPQCGEGALFEGYLKVRPVCEACGHHNGAYRADDGPAYFTMLIVGHILIAPMLCFAFIRSWNPWAILAVTLPAVGMLSLALLAVVKGGFIGVQWGHRAAG